MIDKKINYIITSPPYYNVREYSQWNNFNIKSKNLILAPFMGSGTTGKVAKKFNIKFIGIELNKKYFELSKEKIFLTC